MVEYLYHMNQHLKKHAELDAALVQVAKEIKVLSALGWPEKHSHVFLAAWHKKNPRLPEVEFPNFDFSKQRSILHDIINHADSQYGPGKYIQETASSYILAARLLETTGKAEFREISETLYGSPTDRTGHVSNLDLAEDFIKITLDFLTQSPTPPSILSPEQAAFILKRQADDFFTDHTLKVVVDESLSAKAAAGAERVRIRGGTLFSSRELDQLFQHEILVHSVTMLNGRRQPYFKSMGLGAPRTTATQEGLATFAELITNTMDLSRLRRIALRIKAIQLALDGADFIATFKFFIESGQTEQESFQSAARIFRGGDMRGTNVFTKDVVYLTGLVAVHTFLRKATQIRKQEFPQLLFAGRLALSDLGPLEESFDQGTLAQPHYLPPWVANREGLAAYLCYNTFAGRVLLDNVAMEDFSENLQAKL